MKLFSGMNKWYLGSFLLLSASAYSQQQPGQAVFVQPPYGSSVYTEYRYNPNPQMSNRLPAYTTNQAVFVQQPYGSTPNMRVNAYPSTTRYSTSTNASRYSTPADFPSTTAPAYPFATVRSYASNPYPTTVQYQTSNPTQSAPTYTSTQTYPFTSTRQVVPTPTVQQTSGYNPYGTEVYPTTSNYPSTNYQSPYPMTAAPESVLQPTFVNPPPRR
ncbi:hypothetical protein [Candidatus Protochlamydia phocaeensis]|uniref:hypothetical protein n=1 Tax=Candidatus Protochlamydia phocaeensis TaxID=1414722 RepID=UPI0008381972|nr:hypothetical protein [Candidatus Protochlamydia phocaeensis]